MLGNWCEINNEPMITPERMANKYSKRAGRPMILVSEGINNKAISATRKMFNEHTMIEVRIYEAL